jgi:hypothetical protein
MPENSDIPEDLSLADVAEATPSLPEGGALKIAATEEVAEITKGNEPMIEVHAPHEPVHSWKDALIHIAIIVVGLLIAVGLDETVEYFHHLHQRHDLETALRAETERNKEVAEVNFAGYDEEMTWLLGLHEDILRMLATGGKANLPYRQPHFRSQFANGQKFTSTGEVFATVVWDTAGEDNRLVLLPDEEARAYSLQYRYIGARYFEMQIAIRDDLVRQDAFEAQFADIDTATTPVLARMSPAELKQYQALVMETFTAVRLAKGWLIALYGSNEALRQGRFDPASTIRAVSDASGRYKNNYPKMAQGIAAADAARDKAAGKAAEKGK